MDWDSRSAERTYHSGAIQETRLTYTLLIASHAREWPARLAVVAAGSWLLAASSWIEAPMWPVPMTAQTYAVLLIGAVCGARLAALTVAAYLVQGALGLPMFAGGAAGVLHLIGPTGGYLAGFLFAAALIGWLIEHGWGRSLSGLLAAMALGHCLIFLSGVSWLALFVGGEHAIASGLTPFLLGAVVKTVAAAATVRAGEAVLRR
jgi:biotin transport system substrate-specific component